MVLKFSTHNCFEFLSWNTLFLCNMRWSRKVLRVDVADLLVLKSVSTAKALFATAQLLYNCGRIFFILSFFVLYILPFGLVRLRTFRLVHGLVRCTHRVLVFTRARGVDVTIRDVAIKTPDRKYDQGCKWSHVRTPWGF